MHIISTNRTCILLLIILQSVTLMCYSPILLVDEVKTTMNKISDSLSKCVRLVRRLNAMLPEEDRLEKFRLHPELDDDDSEEDEEGVTAGIGEYVFGGRGRRGGEGRRDGEITCVYVHCNVVFSLSVWFCASKKMLL